MALRLARPQLFRGPWLAVPVVAREYRTSRLLLRPYRMDDADDWLAIENDTVAREGLGWPKRTRPEALAHLRDRTRHTALRQSGDFLVLAFEHDGHVIGDVSLHLRTVAPGTRSLEAGWVQRSDFGGHGYASEAAQAMLAVAFDEAAGCLVTAVVRNNNEPSERLAQRLGFRVAASGAEQTTFVLSHEDYTNRMNQSAYAHQRNAA